MNTPPWLIAAMIITAPLWVLIVFMAYGFVLIADVFDGGKPTIIERKIP